MANLKLFDAVDERTLVPSRWWKCRRICWQIAKFDQRILQNTGVVIALSRMDRASARRGLDEGRIGRKRPVTRQHGPQQIVLHEWRTEISRQAGHALFANRGAEHRREIMTPSSHLLPAKTAGARPYQIASPIVEGQSICQKRAALKHSDVRRKSCTAA